MKSYCENDKTDRVISFILPIYNVAKWLPDCLDSLLEQDIPPEDYEIICVNDGSPDNSREIVLEYAARHSNIVLVDKENGGVSSARNAGIDAASGKYVWFVDPDDKIRANILAKLFEKITDEDVVHFPFEYIEERDFGLKSGQIELNYHSNFQTASSDLQKKFSDNTLAYVSIWSCIVKRSFILQNGFKFNEQMTFVEDVYFKFLIESRCGKSAYIEEALYYYRVRETSAINKRDREFNLKYTDSTRMLAELYNEYLENNVGESSAFYNNCVNKALQAKEYALWSILRLGKEDFKEQLSKLKTAKLYPYKFRSDNLKLKQYPSVKTKLLALLKFLLPIEIYARLVAFVFRHTNLKYQ